MGASLHVFTYKDGLLARLAHDLRLELTDFQVALSGGEVRARFRLDSLRVDGVMRQGALDDQALSARDCEQILEHARVDVLAVDDHPEATFEASVPAANSTAISGRLALGGRTETQEVQLTLGEGEAVARARLVPSRWGIRPFRAMGGAIKLQDAIDVELRLPRPAGVQGDWPQMHHTFVGGARRPADS